MKGFFQCLFAHLSVSATFLPCRRPPGYGLCQQPRLHAFLHRSASSTPFSFMQSRSLSLFQSGRSTGQQGYTSVFAPAPSPAVPSYNQFLPSLLPLVDAFPIHKRKQKQERKLKRRTQRTFTACANEMHPCKRVFVSPLCLPD